MSKLRYKENGYGVIEGLLVITLAVLLVFIGYEVFKNYHKITTAYTNSTKTPVSSNPYAGWKSATLRYEKLSFMYPNNWALTNISDDATTDPGVICVHPGTDNAVLAMPTGESMFLDTGVAIACVGNQLTQVASAPIDVLGGTDYISFLDDSTASGTDGNPIEACLSTSATSLTGLPSKNIFMDAGHSGKPVNLLCFSNAGPGSSSSVHKPVSQMKIDPSFINAESVFRSLKY